MKDVSIEYAHIYTNTQIGDEQELSLKALNEINEEEESFMVLVDDYSFPDPSFDYDSFLSWLDGHGHHPDVAMRESQLIPLCDEVLKLVQDDALKNQITAYVQNKKKYPCSLFIAAWYLLRFGVLQHPDFPETEYAARLINILPESFKPFEDKGFEIIRSTPHATLADKIENRYFQGRLIV